MFYYYTEVPSINHFLVKQQGEKIDFSGIYETVQNVFACFPESYRHKVTQKEEKLVSRFRSGCQLFIACLPKMDQIQDVYSNKLKQASLTIPVDFLIGSDPTPQNMSHPLSSFAAQICLRDRTSGYQHLWRWSAHLLESKLLNLADLLLE